jgi:hypothetical protein
MKPRTTIAEAVLERYGADVCREYITRPADGCTLYRCEKGHDDCAHIKRGVCLQELDALIKVMA